MRASDLTPAMKLARLVPEWLSYNTGKQELKAWLLKSGHIAIVAFMYGRAYKIIFADKPTLQEVENSWKENSKYCKKDTTGGATPIDAVKEIELT